MFSHIFIYRMKCILRDRTTMFWTLVFPIVLSTLFYMAFSNLLNSEMLKEIKIAVVEDTAASEYDMFLEMIDALSGKEGEGDALFEVTYVSSTSEAAELLADGAVKGYIYYEDGLKLGVKENGLEQTILKSVLDDFVQTTSTVTTILESNAAAAAGTLFADIAERNEYISEYTMGRATPDTTVNYFYALIAMTCFYGGFLGLKEVMAVQANQSPQGARVNLAPTHKMKVFVVSMLAAVTTQLFETACLIAYLMFVLRIDFGNEFVYLVVTCIAGAFAGVTFGTFISAVTKKGEGIKVALLISFTMTMSFLSGMMYHGMKTIIKSNVPILSYLNPLNLIADSFYTLYYYTSYTQYFMNLALICGYAVVFGLLTYLVIRRQKYASL